jgi:hypothetical protein
MAIELFKCKFSPPSNIQICTLLHCTALHCTALHCSPDKGVSPFFIIHSRCININLPHSRHVINTVVSQAARPPHMHTTAYLLSFITGVEIINYIQPVYRGGNKVHYCKYLIDILKMD